MNKTEMGLIALLLALAGAAVGYGCGHRQGAAAAQAQQDKQTVQSLTGLIDSHQGLIDQAATASRAMRQALASRAQADATTSKELKNALLATADSRAGCVFPDGVMRQLGAARDRAAQAAAGGIREPLPVAAAIAQQP